MSQLTSIRNLFSAACVALSTACSIGPPAPVIETIDPRQYLKEHTPWSGFARSNAPITHPTLAPAIEPYWKSAMQAQAASEVYRDAWAIREQYLVRHRHAEELFRRANDKLRIVDSSVRELAQQLNAVIRDLNAELERENSHYLRPEDAGQSDNYRSLIALGQVLNTESERAQARGAPWRFDARRARSCFASVYLAGFSDYDYDLLSLLRVGQISARIGEMNRVAWVVTELNKARNLRRLQGFESTNEQLGRDIAQVRNTVPIGWFDDLERIRERARSLSTRRRHLAKELSAREKERDEAQANARDARRTVSGLVKKIAGASDVLKEAFGMLRNAAQIATVGTQLSISRDQDGYRAALSQCNLERERINDLSSAK